MKTLVVEDDLMTQCVLAKVLAERGHEVVSFENAEQAILAYQKEFYPLLFVDAGLPGMGGLEFCRWTRSQPNGDRIFIMVATAAGQPADLGGILAAGANDFLPKPFDVTALSVRLTIAEKQMKSFFDQKELEEGLRRSQESFHRVVRAANEGAWLLNAQFRTDYVNPQMADILGYQVEEMAHHAVADFLPPAAGREAEQVFATLQDGKEVRREFRFRRKDGSDCATFLSAAPIRTERGDFQGTLWMVADLTKAKSLETEKDKARDELKAEAARSRTMEEELGRTRKQSEARVRQLNDELAQSKGSLQAEVTRRKEAVAAWTQVQKDLENRLQKQSDELAKAKIDFQSEASGRKQAEAAVQRARHEAESRTRQHGEELDKAARAMEAEAAERKRLTETLRKLQQDVEARAKKSAEELAQAGKTLQAEIAERKRIVESLQKAQQELESRNRQQAEELVRARESFQAELNDHKRVTEGSQRVRQELETRGKELISRLAQAAEELKNEAAERKRAEQEVSKVRDESAVRVKEHTGELLKLNQEMKAAMAERKRVDDELVKTREELAQRVKDHMAQVVKAGDELRAVVSERTRAEDALVKARRETELELSERTGQLARVRDELQRQIAERNQLEQNLRKTREELEGRLNERAAELAKTNDDLKHRLVELAKTNEELKAEAAARKRADEALQKAKQESELRVAEQTAKLTKANQELSERAAQAVRGIEELKVQAAGLENANQDLKAQIAAQRQAEVRGAAFAKLGKELGAARAPQDAARIVANAAQDLTGWDACSVDLFSAEENKILPVLNIDTINGRAADLPPTYLGPEPSPIMQRVMTEGPQLILRQGRSNSLTNVLLFGDRARLSASLMFVAIKAGAKVVGFVSVQSYTPDAYDQEDLDKLQALADHCGGALERIRAEEFQRSSEERFRLIARATNDVVWDWRLDSNQLWWNEAFYSAFSYQPGDVEPGIDSWENRLHPDDKKRVLTGLRGCIDRGDQSWSDEYRFRRGDGSYAHVINRGYVIRDETNKPVRMVGAMVDVSQRKEVEEAMIEGQARKGAILDAALDGIVTVDHEGRIFEWNAAAEKMFGYRRADVLGKELAQLIIPPPLREQHARDVTKHLASGGEAVIAQRIEMTAMRADGSEFPVELAITRIPTDGPPIYTGFIREMTERKRAESAIQKLAAFPKWNPNPVFEFSGDGTLTYYNDAAQEMALALGRNHPAAILPEHTAEIVKECLAQGHNKLGRETAISGRTISWSFFPIISNQVVHCYAADITDRTSLEAQLRQAQKMESVGQLAAGVAHDFNNLLGIIQGYSTLLMEDKEVKPETAEALQQIHSATQRATHLTRQLLTFSRKQTLHVQTIDLNEVINSVSRLVRRVLGEAVALQYNYSPNLPAVEADTGMMEQLVMNLAINARDAMPQGGQLMIGTRTVDVDEGYVDQNPEACPGRFVCLSVIDTGCGMDEATLGRIFEPFFTTKPSGKGTGLGLATVYGIVKQHHGWIEVQSQVGRGTTFQIYFPASGKVVPATPEGVTRSVVRGGTETILLVEDEPGVLSMARSMLQRLGYRVLDAPSGDDAIPLWRQHASEIHLLLTDMVMPGTMNGRELAERLLGERPDLKVIYTSGYSADLLGTGATASKNFVFLQKPYHADALAQTIRNCLDGKLA